MNKYKEIILDNRIQDHICLAQHLDWEDVTDSLSDILTGILGREVTVSISFYDNGHWAANLSETPLSKEEAGELCRAAHALGSYSVDQFLDDSEPVEALHATVAEFFIEQAMPFSGEFVTTDDKGIWFLSSKQPKDYICLLVTVSRNRPANGCAHDPMWAQHRSRVHKTELRHCDGMREGTGGRP